MRHRSMFTIGTWNTLEGINIRIRDWFNRPCVYAFYFNDELVYIGETSNFSLRFNQHRIYFNGNVWITKWGNFGNFYMKIKYPNKFGEEAMIERRIIERLRPKYNKRVIEKVKYETECSNGGIA